MNPVIRQRALARLLVGRCNPQWPGVKPQRPHTPCGEHWCSKCGDVKPVSAFSPTGRTRKDGTMPLRPYCKACESGAAQERRRG